MGMRFDADSACGHAEAAEATTRVLGRVIGYTGRSRQNGGVGLWVQSGRIALGEVQVMAAVGRSWLRVASVAAPTTTDIGSAPLRPWPVGGVVVIAGGITAALRPGRRP